MTGVLQGFLLGMGIMFEVRQRRRQKKDGENEEVNDEGNGFAGHEDNERTRLLDSER